MRTQKEVQVEKDKSFQKWMKKNSIIVFIIFGKILYYFIFFELMFMSDTESLSVPGNYKRCQSAVTDLRLQT